jgi:hypothetical protein
MQDRRCRSLSVLAVLEVWRRPPIDLEVFEVRIFCVSTRLTGLAETPKEKTVIKGVVVTKCATRVTMKGWVYS